MGPVVQFVWYLDWYPSVVMMWIVATCYCRLMEVRCVRKVSGNREENGHQGKRKRMRMKELS